MGVADGMEVLVGWRVPVGTEVLVRTMGVPVGMMMGVLVGTMKGVLVGTKGVLVGMGGSVGLGGLSVWVGLSVCLGVGVSSCP